MLPKIQRLWLLCLLLCSTGEVFASWFKTPPKECDKPTLELCDRPASPCENRQGPDGWSIDLGGQYTWMSFSTPPTYTGSTGGVVGKLTYQVPWAFFGQARTVYNLGPLSSSLNESGFHEWYMEFVGGYCFPVCRDLTFTPYAGLGFDYLSDDHSAYSTISAIKLRYRTYYAMAGFDTHYAWENWTAGLQFDCFPIFNQYLKVKSLPGAAWILSNRVGFDIRLPVAYKLPIPCRGVNDIWLELAPYYRWLPIGPSTILGLPSRNLDQWGVFLTFRFFL